MSNRTENSNGKQARAQLRTPQANPRARGRTHGLLRRAAPWLFAYKL